MREGDVREQVEGKPSLHIALIAPAWGRLYGPYRKLSREINTTAPLGLAYLAACLKRTGHTVTIIDAEVSCPEDGQIIHVLECFKPDLIGFSATSPVFPEAVRLASVLKRRFKVPFVFGGPHLSAEKSRALCPGSPFDFGLMGDAEGTITKFVQALDGGSDPADVPGIVFRNKDNVVQNDGVDEEQDISNLPHPWFGGIEIRKYQWSVPGRGTRIALPIIASRGCPYHCLFCFKDPRRKGVRLRTVHDVETEIHRRLRETLARHFVFVDDYLTYDRERILSLCEHLSRIEIPFTWEGDTRADGIDEDLLKAMKRADMVRINFGVESGDPLILKQLDKREQLETIRKAFGMAKKAGMETRGSFMLGNPYETRASVIRTLRFAARLKGLDQPYLNITMPYPGTRLREMALRGEGGVRLADPSYDNMGRYGNAIMEVNDITPGFLVQAQRWGLLWIYLQPFRLRHNLTRAGIKGTVRMALTFAGSVLGLRSFR